MQEFSALQTQVDQLTRDIPTGMVLEHARDAFQQVDGHLQRIDTLASVQGHKELVLRAAKQAHFLNLVDDLGPEAMTQPEARELGEQLTAFGLAAGDPELVFLGKANMLLAEASRSVDPDSRDSLIDALGQLAEHPQAADHPTVGRQIPALVELLRDVPQAEPDPQLLLIDHQIATWMAEEPTELGEEQVDRFVELIEANGEELDIDAVELLSDADRHTEKLMLGLRLRDGIPFGWIDAAGHGVVARDVERGLLRHVGDRIALTDAGRLLADGIITDILVAEEA